LSYDDDFFFDNDIHVLTVKATAEATAEANIQEDLMSDEEPYIEETPLNVDNLRDVAMCMFDLHRSNMPDHIPSRVWKFIIYDRDEQPLN
jgi:hypothetical protein